MRLPLILAISSLALAAQSTVPSAKFDPSQFNKALGLDSHIHQPGKCDGTPDAVYMRSGTSYYACVGGKNVCNKDPGEIPAHLISAFQAQRAQFDVNLKQHQADAARHRGMTLHQIHLERTSAKASRAEPSAPGPVATAGPTAGTPPSPIKLADEKTAAVTVGFSRDEVLQALGKPHSRVSGDYEKFSYLLQSGKTFSLEFEAGRVTQVRTVTPN